MMDVKEHVIILDNNNTRNMKLNKMCHKLLPNYCKFYIK